MSAKPRVFVLWFGGHPMPQVRQQCVQSLRASGLDVVVITDEEVDEWLLPGAPLEPAFWLLTPIQRSDYFRAYLMHHHGGAYTDIKRAVGSWLPGLQQLADDPRLWAVGYP
ncbi:MAG: capsular polysaccharide synthesis protein, partial [bacterium]|nr:capsular polysaccharide synthesis protein [bacterium]